jgi:hypothetical protein
MVSSVRRPDAAGQEDDPKDDGKAHTALRITPGSTSPAYGTYTTLPCTFRSSISCWPLPTSDSDIT